MTNDTEIDHLARAIRNHGWARDLPADSPTARPAARRPVLRGLPVHPAGYNVRPLEMCGAVGLEQLKKLDRHARDPPRERGAVSSKLFNGDERFIIQRENGRSSWFSFTIILNPALGIDRAQVMAALRDGGHRLPDDHRRLLSAPRGDQVLRLRHRRRRSRTPTSRTTTASSSATIRAISTPRSRSCARCSTRPLTT